jgi:hypothetical protein
MQIVCDHQDMHSAFIAAVAVRSREVVAENNVRVD